MYKHILIPTDGSETAEKGVQAGLEFAKWAGARVTVFTARPEYRMPGTSEVAAGRVMPIAEYERRSMEEARKILDRVAQRAKAAQVEVDSDAALSDRPWHAILQAAEKHGCDLIFIASHGRKGLSGLLYGSETHEILTHSTVPTLVYR
jgi:nucleotide-binding universal stress UspA family protein